MEYCLLLAYKCVLFLEKYILLRQNKMLKILRHLLRIILKTFKAYQYISVTDNHVSKKTEHFKTFYD